MQDDLTDAVKWAVAEGIADRHRVAIFGVSYGGYAALAGAAFTPDLLLLRNSESCAGNSTSFCRIASACLLFLSRRATVRPSNPLYRCAIDVCGPSNVATCIKSFAPYWGIRSIWNARAGNPDDPADKELLANASPLFAADRIRIAMLIAQGANDPRVIQSESDQIVAAIARNGGRAIYVVYPDEGHGLLRPPNHMDFMARAERFLAEHLGGRYEPMEGEKVPGSTAIVKVIGN
jgi:dipeptidyl aminopeptidase/acylaminoacyl peptidase